ncbi:hypothetical protein V7094_29290 [Priestia megaterium]|uniref:hypothetical protein n=1 Tax=Priestia megaterium TaxID=1404 RepID=UPI0030001AC5
MSQTIYSIGSFAIMLILLKLRFRKHIKTIIVVSILNSIINYLVYFNTGHIHLGFIVPIISVLITFLYLSAVTKVPTLWSFIVTVTGGIVVPVVIQLAITFGSLGYFMPNELKNHIDRNYALDTISGVICCLVAFILYTRGWSFRFDFDKLRFKWERITVITISVLASISLPTAIVVLNIHDITKGLTFLCISSFLAFVFLLGYALKKEKDENDYLNPFKEVRHHD